MLALCQEHRLEHRTKHIALRYFLARELQQRGQLRLAYVAFQANTADVFTKAVQPCDHQRFCTVLGLVVFTVFLLCLLDWSYDPLFSPTLPMGVASMTFSLPSYLRLPPLLPCFASHDSLLPAFLHSGLASFTATAAAAACGSAMQAGCDELCVPRLIQDRVLSM
ncbi:unnamed protein product [Closterium sp. NIES-53]